MRIGCVTGLRAEARCLPRAEAVVCSGADLERARRGAAELLERGVDGLLSFGLAAGLAPHLRPGALVLADAVASPDGTRVAADAGWRARLATSFLDGGMPWSVGSVAGTDRLLASPEDKRALRETTGALAADMESHVVAAAARDAGLPFAVIRAISDGADQTLPSSARDFLSVEGSVRPTVVVGILARPFELAALLRLGLRTRRALLTLRRAAVLGGPALGLG